MSCNLLLNGNMENTVGADWTIAPGTTIAKWAGARTGGAGSYVLRVTAAGVVGWIAQCNLLVGVRYRISGWARSGSTEFPTVTLASSSTVIWTGATGTDWKYFDVSVVIPDSNTSIQFGKLSTGTYVEFDDLRVEQVFETGTQLLSDGAFEDSNTMNWGASPGATISKVAGAYATGKGIRVLRVASAAMGLATGYGMAANSRYRLTGWAMSDGTSTPIVTTNNGAEVIYLWRGVAGNGWQPFDLTFTSSNSTFLNFGKDTAGAYAQFDAVRLVANQEIITAEVVSGVHIEPWEDPAIEGSLGDPSLPCRLNPRDQRAFRRLVGNVGVQITINAFLSGRPRTLLNDIKLEGKLFWGDVCESPIPHAMTSLGGYSAEQKFTPQVPGHYVVAMRRNGGGAVLIHLDVKP